MLVSWLAADVYSIDKIKRQSVKLVILPVNCDWDAQEGIVLYDHLRTPVQAQHTLVTTACSSRTTS